MTVLFLLMTICNDGCYMYWWSYIEYRIHNQSSIVQVLSIVSHLYSFTWFGTKVWAVCINFPPPPPDISILEVFSILSSWKIFPYFPQLFNSTMFHWGGHIWFKIVNKLTELLKDHQIIIHFELTAKYLMFFKKIVTYFLQTGSLLNCHYYMKHKYNQMTICVHL